MSVGTRFWVIFGAAGAGKIIFWRRRRRKLGFGGDFRAISLRKMHQNQLENPLLLSGFSGFRSFLKRIFQVFIVFWMVFVDILRISMDFKAFWTGPSLARVHFPLHFIDFRDFFEFP